MPRRASDSPSPGGFTGWEKEITHITGAGEPEIAVGPNGSPLVVAFNSCGVAVSHDRGNTFAVSPKNPADPGPTPGDPVHNCSDPAAALGPDDALYTGAGYWDTPGGDADYYNMFVSRSGDGGMSWTKPVFATGDQAAPQQLLLGRNTGHTDRLFLTVDGSNGSVYASATDFPRLVRWLVVSHDAGATFGSPHAIDSNQYPQAQGEQAGDYIPAAANGVVAVAYAASAAPGASCPCGIFETSHDDGASWTRYSSPFIANWTAADPSHPGQFAIMSGQGVTATPANPGYITVSTTSDYGRTWTKPVLIGDGLHPRIQPWLAYSPTGALGVGYKTLHTGLIAQPTFFEDAAAGSVPGDYDFWTAVSFDNGRSFSDPVRVSNAPSPPGSTGGNDDFSSVALDDDYLYASWGDQRTSPTNPAPGPVSVYFARVPLTVYAMHSGPGRKGCPAASGKLTPGRIGPLALGMARPQARHAARRSSRAGTKYEDFFCLTPVGIRVGYASRLLLRRTHAPTRLAGRVVWISTANRHYGLAGITAGATARAAGHAIPGGTSFRVGLNSWYLVAWKGATAVFKIRHGIVQEVGVAARPVTRTRKDEHAFLTSGFS